MGALGTLVGLLVAAAVMAFLAYFFYVRRQSSSDADKDQPHQHQHAQAVHVHTPAPTAAPVHANVEKPASSPGSVAVPIAMPMPTPTPSVTPPPPAATAAAQQQQQHQQDIPAVVQSYQQLQQAVSAPTSPVDQPQIYPPAYPPQQQQQQPQFDQSQPTFNAPLELPILPPSPPPNTTAANDQQLHHQPIPAPAPAQLSPADGPILPTSTPPPHLPVLSTTSSSLLAVPTAAPALFLTPPTLPSAIPSDPTGWPAPGLESFAQVWHAHPYIHGARTSRQPFISHSHDELAVSVGDRIVVTLVFSDGWGLGYRVGPGDLPLTNVTEGVFPLCVLQPEAGDDALVALERDLIARQQKQAVEDAQAQQQAQQQQQQTQYFVSLPRAAEGSAAGSLPKSSLARALDEPHVNVVGDGDARAFEVPPEIAVQVERGASLARRQK